MRKAQYSGHCDFRTSGLLALCTLLGACTAESTPCEDNSACSLGEICRESQCVHDEESTPGLTEEERDDLGEPEGLGGGSEPTDYGAVIDSFCGVDARQNGPDPAYTLGFEGTYGYEFQCTELAYRFLCQYFDMCSEKVGAFGNAGQWFDNVYDNTVLEQLTRYDNGGAEPPRPGDVLVSTTGKWGHVAIVKSIDEDFVHVLEQNVYQGVHRYAIDTSGGKYTMSAGWRGWMRAPGGPASCEQGEGECGCEGILDSTSIVDNKLFVAGSVHCPQGIDKWSLAVHDKVVHSDFPNGEQIASFSEIIDLSEYAFDEPDVSVGLWVRPVGDDACLLDDEEVDIQKDACVPTSSTQCEGDSVVYVDTCGGVAGVAQVCAGNASCVATSPSSATCQVAPPGCNNMSIDPGEECDGSKLGGQSCTTLGYSGGVLKCSAACSLDTSGCLNESQCGDGKIDPGEDCDGGDLGGAGCSSLGYDYGSLTRSGACSFNTSGCMNEEISCGNGVIDQGEQCDGNSLGSASCVSLGFSSGSLGCSNGCDYDVDNCVSEPVCSYGVNPKYPVSSYYAPYVCPGDIVMPISGSLSNSGYLTVSSPEKPDGFGEGIYRVLVFDPKDSLEDQCKPWNVVKATKVLNSKKSSLTFPAFDSLLKCSEQGDEKAYCIVKEAGNSIAHFCSGKLIAKYN